MRGKNSFKEFLNKNTRLKYIRVGALFLDVRQRETIICVMNFCVSYTCIKHGFTCQVIYTHSHTSTITHIERTVFDVFFFIL